jgi:chromosome segregation ATPase
MIGKFVFVSLCLTVFVQLLPSGSSPRKEQIPAVGQKLFGLGCHNEKKRIDQLVGTIDALKQQIPAKNTLADMENALRREKAKNQELLNAISEHVTKEHEHEQQKKNLEERIVYLDNKVETLLSNFTDCKENHEVLVQKVTNQLQSCEYERKMGKKNCRSVVSRYRGNQKALEQLYS